MLPSKSLLIIMIGVLCQSDLGAQKIDQNNVPDEIRACMRSTPGMQLDVNINPFYISGNFIGTGATDFAVLVRNQADRGPGIHHILFCLGNDKHVLWDAGTDEGAVASPFTAWLLVPRQSKLLSIHPKIKHDCLAILIGEEGGGLVYWDGQKFAWQQEE